VRAIKRRAAKITYICIIFLVIILNIAAWNSAVFCDWYIAHIFPIWVNTYGRVTGMFPFSVGEWLIALGLLLVAVAVVLPGIWGAASIAAILRGSRLSGRLFSFAKGFYRFFAWAVALVCLIMTLNCFILYHASAFSERYFGTDNREYGLEELFLLYNRVASECNRLSEEIERDETGMAVYGGSSGEMADEARRMMKRLGEKYSQLSGYYPRPKPLLTSDFMCQQHMQGYYFPFSMEANYNDVMHILNIPATMCHELAHLRGYIYEDEANFIGYLACVQSEDAFFRYAGYLSVLNYVYNDLYGVSQTQPEVFSETAQKIAPVAIKEQVWIDNIFVTQEEWDRINAKAFFNTDTVDRVTDVLIDANLKANGIADGKISYSRVVRLLLQYYAGENQ